MSANDPHTLTILTGPTAVGKTALALAWAREHEAEIVSCDSTLVYRGLDIATAKPTQEELAQVPHHLIDVVPVACQLSVVDYLEMARAAVAGIHARGKRVLVTGGSGFYLKGFFAAVADDVPISDEVRAEVRVLDAAEGLPGLLRRLREVSPDTGSLDVQNPRRVVRALERCLASGQTVAELERAFREKAGVFDAFPKHIILLQRTEESLHARIAARTQQMLADGLIEETERLLAEGLENNPSAAGSIGTREALAFLRGELPGSELEPAINQATRRLVAKQRKWFRHQIAPDEVVELG
ncbi:tRNA (adenosine(37)-N6)-dimethylallyltransferase MiaA [Ruficoccus sp. ZRK36]|uniref:tRNA (adenosine(37)-N6)-dimethylallyltransferase MiaA n=1 Tax=Ruficoccus sp. ZRK36 TaxID=2866311 RepID=UPI001C739A7D|nr:tRNA (adenosine(37)-N6)-dimethylallyltransferase MiaA [Ruficoccus sp. ZRK36]QYY36201.1 tRNA (adenosine(37)-N6)-dimethylallyltransferase MiaA [Ruficoccus sp. ZRK36]